MLMRGNGRLYPAGVAFIQRVLGSSLDGEDIERIFDPDSILSRREVGLRLRWREAVVAADARRVLNVRPCRLDTEGELSFSGTAEQGVFGNTDGPRFVLVAHTLVNVIEFFARVRAINATEETFQLDGSDIREWSIVHFLAYALRGDRDPNFTTAYAKTHVHYLSRRFTDPLKMVATQHIAPGPLRAQRMTLEQFWGLAADDLPIGGERRSRRTRLARHIARTYRRGLPIVGEQIILGAQHWFDFLFGDDSFVGDLNVGALRSALVDASSPCDLGVSTGIKAIAPKKPDIVQIFVDRRHVEVLDATMRPLDRWHNFKTECYAAILRAVLRNLPDDWTVEPVDFKSREMMYPLS